MEKGDIAKFFCKDLALALAPKMCPDQSQAFKEVNNSQAFAVARKKITRFFFLAEPLPGAPRHVCTKFRANILRTDCVEPALNHVQRPKMSLRRNQVITMRNRDFCTFSAYVPQRRFREMDTEIIYTRV